MSSMPWPDPSRSRRPRFFSGILAALRKVGKIANSIFRPLRDVAALLAAMWPVSVALIVLALCFLLPGLANSQTFEAMLEYAGVGIAWERLAGTVLATFLLGTVMADSARDLLNGRIHNGLVTWGCATLISAGCRWFPALAVALAFMKMQSIRPGFFFPYVMMALALITLQAIMIVALRAASQVQAVKAFCSLIVRQKTALAVISVAGACLFFGTGDKDSFIGLPVSSVAVSQALGPVNILILFLTAFLAIMTALVRLERVVRLPLIWILAGIALIVSRYDLNDNHIVRQSIEKAAKAPSVEDAFDQWMNSRSDGKLFSEYPVILVSAEGGGIRAAFFTAITLGRIADRCPAMAGHIFAISGVSGGAIGAALYAGAIKAKPIDVNDRRCDMTKPAPPVYENALAAVLTDDHLSPLLARMLFPDLVQQIIPYPILSFDRQRGLEYSIERSFRRAFGQDLMSGSIYDLRPSQTSLDVPYLFLNTTEVQSGRRFVVTPLFLQSQPFGGAQDWHWIDWDHGPPLSAAAGVSARFPIFSPAGYAFNNGRKARYVDAGYVDNSGSVTLAEIFNALYLLREEKYLDDDNGRKSTRFAMTALHIGNAPACDVIRDEIAKHAGKNDAPRCDPNEQAAPAGGLSEVLSPLEAVIAVRSAQVEYNLYQFYNRIDLGTDLHRYDFHARVQMYDRSIPVPLGWLLSRRVGNELRSQLDARPDELECGKQIADSNFCELRGAVAGITWADGGDDHPVDRSSAASKNTP